jgi:hypothetical protein
MSADNWLERDWQLTPEDLAEIVMAPDRVQLARLLLKIMERVSLHEQRYEDWARERAAVSGG